MGVINMISNGDFETGSFSPWTSVNTVIDSTRSHTGFFSARFPGNIINSYILQTFPANPGDNFEIFLALSKSGAFISPQFTITIAYYRPTFTFINNGLVLIIPSGEIPDVGNNEWAQIYAISTPAPAFTTRAQVLINKNALVANTPDVFADDIFVIKKT